MPYEVLRTGKGTVRKTGAVGPEYKDPYGAQRCLRKESVAVAWVWLLALLAKYWSPQFAATFVLVCGLVFGGFARHSHASYGLSVLGSALAGPKPYWMPDSRVALRCW